MENCPNCNSSDISFSDCGYSTFNVATIKCRNCAYTLKLNGFDADEYLTKFWDKHCKLMNELNNRSKDDLIKIVKTLIYKSPVEMMEFIDSNDRIERPEPIVLKTCLKCSGLGKIFKREGFLTGELKCNKCNGLGHTL